MTMTEALLQPGTRLGPYRIEERVGSGGMSTVYRATDTRLERTVALKLLFQRGIEDLARFSREASLTARLDHPGIARILDVSTNPPYLVMPFIDGVTLGHYAGDRLVALRDAARAIEHAHGRGVLHRDLKPENIMVDGDGRAVVLDFGLARCFDKGWSVTQNEILGTPAFMSPEQALGRRDQFGPHTDVYGLGATLYDLIAGHPPHDGDSPYAILKAIVDRDAPVPEGPRELVLIAMTALAREPANRYRSAGAFADDLDRYLTGVNVAARAPGLVTQIRWRFQRNPLIWSLATVLALTVILSLTGGFVLLLASHHATQRELAAEHELHAADLAQERQIVTRGHLEGLRRELEEIDDQLAGRLEPAEMATLDARLSRITDEAGQLAAQNPDDPEPRWVQGRSREFARDESAAQAAYAACISRGTAHDPLVARALAAVAKQQWRDALLGLSWTELKAGRAERIVLPLSVLDHALDAGQAGETGSWLVAQRMLTGKDVRSAASFLDNSLARGGRIEDLLLLAAALHLDHPAVAGTDAEQSLARYRGHPLAWLLLAVAQRIQGGDAGEVTANVDEALRLAPIWQDKPLVRSLLEQ